MAFVYFDNLRDKHLVHDVNPYAQPIPGAVLNKPGFGPKIAKIVCSGMVANTLEFANVSNLHLLISHALNWVAEQFDKLCEVLTAELEATSYEDLLGREDMMYRAPTLEEIGTKRRSP